MKITGHCHGLIADKTFPLAQGLSLHWVLMVPLALSITSSTALAGCLLYPPMPPTSRPLLLLALGAIAPAIVQGLILRRVLDQLNRVSQVSRELAAGHLSHRLPTDSPGVELSQLAKAINQLADQTQQSLQGMQTALTASEQWLAQYSQISPSMIYTFVEVIEGGISERQGRFEYISAALEEVGEVSVEAGLQDANAVRRLIHPDDAAGYLVAELESKQTLSTFSHQCRIVTPSGRVKWVHTQSQPQRRADGTVAWYGWWSISAHTNRPRWLCRRAKPAFGSWPKRWRKASVSTMSKRATMPASTQPTGRFAAWPRQRRPVAGAHSLRRSRSHRRRPRPRAPGRQL